MSGNTVGHVCTSQIVLNFANIIYIHYPSELIFTDDEESKFRIEHDVEKFQPISALILCHLIMFVMRYFIRHAFVVL